MTKIKEKGVKCSIPTTPQCHNFGKRCAVQFYIRVSLGQGLLHRVYSEKCAVGGSTPETSTPVVALVGKLSWRRQMGQELHLTLGPAASLNLAAVSPHPLTQRKP